MTLCSVLCASLQTFQLNVQFFWPVFGGLSLNGCHTCWTCGFWCFKKTSMWFLTLTACHSMHCVNTTYVWVDFFFLMACRVLSVFFSSCTWSIEVTVLYYVMYWLLLRTHAMAVLYVMISSPVRTVCSSIHFQLYCLYKQTDPLFCLHGVSVLWSAGAKFANKQQQKPVYCWCHHIPQNVTQRCAGDLYCFIHQSQTLPTCFCLQGWNFITKIRD